MTWALYTRRHTFSNVTGDKTYYAVWTITPLDLPDGLYVDSVAVVENDPDASGYNSSLGYNYRPEKIVMGDSVNGYFDYFVPTLTLLTDGHSVSGTVDGGVEDSVRIRFDPSVATVTFSNLSITAEHTDTIVYSSSAPITITIEGDCSFENTAGYVLYLEGGSIEGTGSSSSLSLHGSILTYGDIEIKDLTFNVAQDSPMDTFSFAGTLFSFVNADVTVETYGWWVQGSLLLSGSTNFTFTSLAVENPGYAFQITGNLTFEDFTGTCSLLHKTNLPGPRVLVRGSIVFKESGSNVAATAYLGTLQIIDLGVDGKTFGTGTTPAPSVTIKKTTP